MFEAPLAKMLVAHLWVAFAGKRFMKECQLYGLLIVSYTAAFIISQDICDRSMQFAHESVGGSNVSDNARRLLRRCAHVNCR